MTKSWIKSGAPWIWLHAGAVSLCMIMVVGLLGLIAIRGFGHFWPADLLYTTIQETDGTQRKVLAEHVRSETITAAVAKDAGYSLSGDEPILERHLFKVGNRDIGGRDFLWFLDVGMGEWTYPEDAIEVERREWGNFYGFPTDIIEAGEVVVSVQDADFWTQLDARVQRSLDLHAKIKKIEKRDIGRINYAMEQLRLEGRRLDLAGVTGPARALEDAKLEEQRAELESQFVVLKKELDALRAEMKRDELRASIASGDTVSISLGNIVRVTRSNELSVLGKLVEYVDRFWEFLVDDPREANTEGGIFPAIFGTVVMVFVMSIIVTPFGVMAAIYLREYAKEGPALKLIRISVYNLAGVPSIVYGVFGLGFFVYFLGGSIDELFYPESLPSPTFGTPGLFWASLTLALLTLPVVIVSTEEGLSRIPSSIRQGSLALGATKAETLWKVVVPLATPAMMTGLILAIARAAGEVAPLMLVGVVKLAPTLPVDGNFPFLQLDRKIMHLGFHIYDVGFQSPNVEAARPLVYATALTLVILIVALNLTAISIRNRLREKYRSQGD